MRNIIFAVLAVFSLSTFAVGQKEKISPEEIISKHLASIGTPEARSAAKSRVLVGQAMLSSKVGYSGRIGGPAQVASDANKLLLAIVFNSNDYKYEKLAFDGKDISYGRPFSNELTTLGNFIKAQPTVIKQGLLGGVNTSGWILQNLDAKKLKAEYIGQETLDGKTFLKLRIRPSGSGELKIVLYFDVDTFQHRLTQYQYTIQPYLATSDSTENSRAKAQHFSMTEQFSDFKKVGDLVLPLSYSINISNHYEDRTEELTWTMKFKDVYFNEPLEPSVFKVS
jgi:hypothetical protein